MNTGPSLVIVDGLRTPFCKAGTALASMPPDELGRQVVNALLTRTGFDPGLIDEVIFGCVAQPVDAPNVARVIALRAGIPVHVPAVTVHRNCASGFESFTQAYERMAAGRGSVYLVGGAESMSEIPMLLKQETADKIMQITRAKTPLQKLAGLASFRPSDLEPRVGLKLGLTDPYSGLNMGETAEVLVRELGISRESQDLFALRSHQRAVASRDKLAEEIFPVFVRATGQTVTSDNGPRENQTLEALAKLAPVFDHKHGTVTAGNSSQITDGAVALLVMTEKRASELGYQPLGRLAGYAYTGCDPARMGLGPVSAIHKLEREVGVRLQDADIIEINEAFAAQVLAVTRQLGCVAEGKLNVNGGAIALGHPVGATGARLILTALRELHRRDARRALVSLCVGGGQGGAIWLEKM